MAINKDFLVKNGLQVGGNTQLTGSLTAAGLSYPVSDGDPYMAMVTDGNGNLSFNNVDTVESDVTNNTGSLIPKGTPVYQTGAAGQTLTIAPSDASNAATMPAIGVAASDIADGDTGRVIHFGYIKGVDTSAFSEGSRIYVADGGGYQEGRPTGEANVVQFLGVVTKVHATNGSGVVFGGGRAHAVPNLDDGNIFIGDNTDSPVTATLDTSIVPENGNIYFTNQRAIDAIEGSTNLTIDGGTLYIDTSNNYIGINDTSPQQALDVTGAIAVGGTTVIDSGSEVVTAQLKDSGVTAGSYGSASLVPIITVDAKGRITSASTTSVAGVSNFTFNNVTDVLTIDTADGGSYTADISDITVGGSMDGPLADLTIVYQSAAPSSPSQGQMWFDSLNQLLMVYTGSSWVQAVPGGGSSGGGDTTDAVATMEKYTYTLGSTTNAVSGSDDNGETLAYVVDGSQNVEVFVNGIKQVEGASADYVATTGTAVTFTYNIPSGSVVDVQVFELLTQDAFYLKADTYNRTEVNSQISTALGDYLPIAGGTLTGGLSGTTGNFTSDFTVDTNTLHVDSTNNRVGIGTTSPTLALDIRTEAVVGNGTNGVKLTYSNSNSTGIIDTGFSSTGLEFRTGNSFAGKIDSAGNLLFGKDVTTYSTEGFNYEKGGALELTRDSGRVLRVHRTTNDGTLVEFNKTSTLVGSINTEGNDLAIGNGDAGLQFINGTQSVRPFNVTTNARIDAQVDLGMSTTRFKDLYLSGTANVSEVNSDYHRTVATQEKSVYLSGLSEGSEYLLASVTLSGESGSYVEITGTINSAGTISAGSTIHARYSVERTYGGTVTATKLSYTADNGGIKLRKPVINGNSVEFYFTTYNNGTTTSPSVKASVKAINASITMGDGSSATSSGASNETEGAFIDGDVDIGSGTFVFDDSTKLLTIENSGTNTGGLNINSNNGRIYFGGRRAIEGTSDGSNIFFGEGYSAIYLQDNTTINGTSDALTANTVRAGTLISMRLNGTQEGTINVSTSGTTYNTTSDRRLKDNIVTITDGKEKLLAMNPVTHTWKADPDAQSVHGFIAQEMQEVVPEAVSGDPDGEAMMSMDYGRITPVIVAALQDALKEIEELKTRINELEAK